MTECHCLTYELDGHIDVAAYSISCPIHGWRWDYTGPILTLAGYEAIDNEKRIFGGGEEDD